MEGIVIFQSKNLPKHFHRNETEHYDHLNCRPVLRQLLSNALLAIEQAAFICEVNSPRYKTAALCSIRVVDGS